MLTLQEVFNAVWERAKDKTKASTNDKWKDCLYRASDGRKCFMGILIPDAEYAPAMEGESIRGIINKIPSLKGLDLEHLYNLQTIHDSYSVEQWGDKLRDFAHTHNLTVPD